MVGNSDDLFLTVLKGAFLDPGPHQSQPLIQSRTFNSRALAFGKECRGIQSSESFRPRATRSHNLHGSGPIF
jgi:hypothetical protein